MRFVSAWRTTRRKKKKMTSFGMLQIVKSRLFTLLFSTPSESQITTKNELGHGGRELPQRGFHLVWAKPRSRRETTTADSLVWANPWRRCLIHTVTAEEEEEEERFNIFFLRQSHTDTQLNWQRSIVTGVGGWMDAVDSGSVHSAMRWGWVGHIPVYLFKDKYIVESVEILRLWIMGRFKSRTRLMWKLFDERKNFQWEPFILGDD